MMTNHLSLIHYPRLLRTAISVMLMACAFITARAQVAADSAEGLVKASVSQAVEEQKPSEKESASCETMTKITIVPEPLRRPFLTEESRERLLLPDNREKEKQEQQELSNTQANVGKPDSSGNSSSQANGQNHGVQWRKLYRQSLLFLSIEHGFRLATQPDTRASLRGPFFKDYFKSVRNLRGWGDGDPFLTNYIGHGMMGAVTGFMWLNNDPKSRKPDVQFNREYFKHRLRAMTFSAVYSTQFELGLISEATLGNVGLVPGDKSPHPMAYTDLVITPTLGTLWLIGEDALERFVVRPIERRTSNRFSRLMVRSWLNPSRSFANLLRGKWFWYRDDRRL